MLDRRAAMQQDTLIAINVSDGGLARGGRGETGIIGEGAGLRVELADVEDVRADRAGFDGKLNTLAVE